MGMAYTLIAALVIAGWVLVYMSSRRALRRTCAELRLEFQQQIDALSANSTARERTAAGKTADVTSSTKQQAIVTRTPEQITSETLATIAETITALLGRKVRIRSVILETPSVVANPWAQQGRVVVQASHNVAQRGRE